MKHSEEEQKYMADMKRAFEEQKDVQLRELSMTKERYQQLAYTYCKITDEEEMKDFAYISTHNDVRLYYLSDTNLALLERIDSFKPPKNPLDKCIGTEYSFVEEGKLREDYICGHSLAVKAKIRGSIDVNTIEVRLSHTGYNQLIRICTLASLSLLGFSTLITIFIIALKNL